jgi:hypothetical protein
MGAALKLGIATERILHLVSPPPIPPKRPELTGQRMPLPRPPTLPRVDPESDPAPEEMTAEDRARRSYTMLLGLHQQFPKVSETVEHLLVDVDSLTRFTHTHIDRLDKRIDTALRTPSSFPPAYQPYVDRGIAKPSKSGNNLTVDAADYVASEERSTSLRVQVETLDERLAQMEAAKKAAEDKEAGAKDALMQLEAKNLRRRNTLFGVIGAAAAAGAVLRELLSHLGR